MQGRNRDADTENGRVGRAGEGEGDTNCQSSTDMYILPRVKGMLVGSCHIIQGAQPSALWPPRGVGLWGEGGSRGRSIHTYIYGYLLCPTAETNTTL